MTLFLTILFSFIITDPTTNRVFTLEGSAVMMPVATPTPTPLPTITPTPTPTPVVLPVFVPEPVLYSLPAALRTVNVATQVALDVAILAAVPGDRIVLAAGKYSPGIQLLYRNGGTTDTRIVFLGQSGASVDGVKLVGGGGTVPSWVTIAGLKIGKDGVVLNGAHHIDIVHNDIATSGSACGVYLTNTPDNTGYFSILNNRMQWLGKIVPAGYSAGAPMAAIYFEAQRAVGYNCRIEGNFLRAWHDGIHLGEVRPTTISHNMRVVQNFVYDCEDDGLELDGWHENLYCAGNVIGGTQMSMLAAISVAPLGPTGPYLITKNSLGGYYKMPLKLNNAVDGAVTANTEFSFNICIQPLTDATVGFYLPGPMTGVSNLNINNNVILSRGVIFCTEQRDWGLPGYVIPGLQIDRNRMYSTLERKLYGAPTLFRFLDTSNPSLPNVYMDSLVELQQKFHFEMSGTYAPFQATPIKIETFPGSGVYFPVEKLCKWSIQ